MRNNGHDGDSGFTFELHAVLSIVHEVAIYRNTCCLFFPRGDILVCTWHLYKSFHVAAQLWMKKRHDAENRFCIEKENPFGPEWV